MFRDKSRGQRSNASHAVINLWTKNTHIHNLDINDISAWKTRDMILSSS